jgi:hypothetical protein
MVVRANGLQQLDPLPARQSVDACCRKSSGDVTVRLRGAAPGAQTLRPVSPRRPRRLLAAQKGGPAAASANGMRPRPHLMALPVGAVRRPEQRGTATIEPELSTAMRAANTLVNQLREQGWSHDELTPGLVVGGGWPGIDRLVERASLLLELFDVPINGDQHVSIGPRLWRCREAKAGPDAATVPVLLLQPHDRCGRMHSCPWTSSFA